MNAIEFPVLYHTVPSHHKTLNGREKKINELRPFRSGEYLGDSAVEGAPLVR